MAEITLAWNEANTDETGHKIYRSTSSIDTSSPGSPLALVGAKTGSGTYTDTDVGAGFTYYRVSAYRTADSSEVFSAQQSIEVIPSGNYDLEVGTTITITPQAHFDASQMTGSNNTGWSDEEAVGASKKWFDRTGQYSMTHATATKQLVWLDGTTTGGINSLPAVSLYSTTVRMGLFYDASGSNPKNINLTTADGWSIYGVWTNDSSPATNYAVMMEGAVSELGGTGYYRSQINNVTSGQTKVYGSVSPLWTGTAVAIDFSMDTVADKRFIMGTNCSESSGSTTRFRRADGSASDDNWEEDSDADDGFRMELSQLQSSSTNNTYGHNGLCAELLFFNEVLSASDRGLVEGYLEDKYNIDGTV